MIYTNETKNERQLRKLFAYGPNMKVSEIVDDGIGQWKNEAPDRWRFWRRVGA